MIVNAKEDGKSMERSQKGAYVMVMFSQETMKMNSHSGLVEVV